MSESDIDRAREHKEEDQRMKAERWFAENVAQEAINETFINQPPAHITRSIVALNFSKIFLKTDKKLSFASRISKTFELILSGGEWMNLIKDTDINKFRAKEIWASQVLRDKAQRLKEAPPTSGEAKVLPLSQPKKTETPEE